METCTSWKDGRTSSKVSRMSQLRRTATCLSEVTHGGLCSYCFRRNSTSFWPVNFILAGSIAHCTFTATRWIFPSKEHDPACYSCHKKARAQPVLSVSSTPNPSSRTLLKCVGASQHATPRRCQRRGRKREVAETLETTRQMLSCKDLLLKQSQDILSASPFSS